MNKIVKNPFERKQKGTVSILCITCIMCMSFCWSCQTKNATEQPLSDEQISTNLLLSKLESALSVNVFKEDLPEWLVVRIDDYYETRPPSICKILIYRGEWNKQVVYCIMDMFSSHIFDFFTEDGGRMYDNLSDCYATSKNWIIIYEYGDIVIDFNELYSY